RCRSPGEAAGAAGLRCPVPSLRPTRPHTNLLSYPPTCARALCRGALEIWITPWNGRSSSRIRKTALETAKTQSNKEANAIGLGGASRLKLASPLRECGRLTRIAGSVRFTPPDEHSPQRFTALPIVRLLERDWQCHSVCKS